MTSTPPNQQQPDKKGQRIALASLLVAIISMVAAVVVVPDVRDWLGLSNTFTYTVRVQAEDTGQAIAGAAVALDVPGRAPLRAVTDSDGVARLIIDNDLRERESVLRIEASGFALHTEALTLEADRLPATVQLAPQP